MTATPTPKPRRQDRIVGLSIVGAIVLAVGAVSAGYAVGLGASSSDAAAAGDGSSTSVPSRPAPETGAPGAPLPETGGNSASVVPADCADIYSTDWSTQMGGLVLNPARFDEPGQPPMLGSTDDELVAILKAADPLNCRWGGELGGGDRFLVTSVASLHGEQPSDVLARLGALGLSCYEELGGTRCVIEETDSNGFSGQSHFVRDGVWIATRWVSVAPDGYTHDIVNTLWP